MSALRSRLSGDEVGLSTVTPMRVHEQLGTGTANRFDEHVAYPFDEDDGVVVARDLVADDDELVAPAPRRSPGRSSLA